MHNRPLHNRLLLALLFAALGLIAAFLIEFYMWSMEPIPEGITPPTTSELICIAAEMSIRGWPVVMAAGIAGSLVVPHLWRHLRLRIKAAPHR